MRSASFDRAIHLTQYLLRIEEVVVLAGGLDASVVSKL
jgi:hypothetical protein